MLYKQQFKTTKVETVKIKFKNQSQLKSSQCKTLKIRRVGIAVYWIKEVMLKVSKNKQKLILINIKKHQHTVVLILKLIVLLIRQLTRN